MCKVTQDTQRSNLQNKTERLTGVQTTTQESDQNQPATHVNSEKYTLL